MGPPDAVLTGRAGSATMNRNRIGWRGLAFRALVRPCSIPLSPPEPRLGSGDGLTISGSVGYLDAKYIKGLAPVGARRRTSPASASATRRPGPRRPISRRRSPFWAARGRSASTGATVAARRLAWSRNQARPSRPRWRISHGGSLRSKRQCSTSDPRDCG